MKMFRVFVLVCFFVLLSGCKDDYVPYESLSKDEVISLAKDKIREEHNRDVSVNILSKYPYNVCDIWFFGCRSRLDLEGTYEYRLEVIDKDHPSIRSKDCYYDDFYKEKGHIRGGDFSCIYLDELYEKEDELYLLENAFDQIADVKYFRGLGREHVYYLYTHDFDNLALEFESISKEFKDKKLDIYVIPNLDDYLKVKEIDKRINTAWIKNYNGNGLDVFPEDDIASDAILHIYNHNGEFLSYAAEIVW